MPWLRASLGRTQGPIRTRRPAEKQRGAVSALQALSGVLPTRARAVLLRRALGTADGAARMVGGRGAPPAIKGGPGGPRLDSGPACVRHLSCDKRGSRLASKEKGTVNHRSPRVVTFPPVEDVRCRMCATLEERNQCHHCRGTGVDHPATNTALLRAILSVLRADSADRY